MIDYGEQASNQIQFPGLGEDGEKLMDEARAWVDAHEHDFARYMRLARRQMLRASDGKASPNACKEQMRAGMDVNFSIGEHGAITCDERRCVSIRNAFAPCLARIAMERDRSLDFRTARSKSDGFTTAFM
jgi:hypothetical protein